MNLINLYDFIKHIEYGTNLHISILFFGNYGNDILHLPHNHTVHFTPVCNAMKNKSNGLKRCLKCRNMAIAKAIKTKRLPPQLISTLEHDLGIFIENYIRMMLPYISRNLSKNQSSLIENIKNYIQENTQSKNNISEIANIFHYNAKYIGQLFKKETGITLNEYVNVIRLEHSKILLSKSDKTIISIAFETGYNSVSYFNRVFKNHFKLSFFVFDKFQKNIFRRKSYIDSLRRSNSERAFVVQKSR